MWDSQQKDASQNWAETLLIVISTGLFDIILNASEIFSPEDQITNSQHLYMANPQPGNLQFLQYPTISNHDVLFIFSDLSGLKNKNPIFEVYSFA